MSNSNTANRELEKRVAAMRDKFSAGANWAVIVCAPAYRFGCNYGLLKRDNPEYKDILTALAEEKQHLLALQVRNGAVVYCEEALLAHVVNGIAGGGIDNTFVEAAKRRKHDETLKLNKFLHGVLTGKRKVNRNPDGTMYLGVLCTNEVNVIRINGIDYPAFKMTPEEVVLQVQLVSSNIGKAVEIAVMGQKGSNQTLLLDSRQIGGPDVFRSVYSALEIAETGTGAFMTIKF